MAAEVKRTIRREIKTTITLSNEDVRDIIGQHLLRAGLLSEATARSRSLRFDDQFGDGFSADVEVTWTEVEEVDG